MGVREWLKRLWNHMAAFAEAMDYDPQEECRKRVLRLEKRVAELEGGTPVPGEASHDQVGTA